MTLRWATSKNETSILVQEAGAQSVSVMNLGLFISRLQMPKASGSIAKTVQRLCTNKCMCSS